MKLSDHNYSSQTYADFPYLLRRRYLRDLSEYIQRYSTIRTLLKSLPHRKPELSERRTNHIAVSLLHDLWETYGAELKE